MRKVDKRFNIGLIIIIIGVVWMALAAFLLQGAGTIHYILSFCCIIIGLIIMHTGDDKEKQKPKLPHEIDALGSVNEEEIKVESEATGVIKKKKKKVWIVILAVALVVLCAGGIYLITSLTAQNAQKIEEYNNTLYRYYVAHLTLVDNGNDTLENFGEMCNLADAYGLALNSIPEDVLSTSIDNLETFRNVEDTIFSEIEAPPRECQEGYEIAQKIHEAIQDKYLTMQLAFEDAAVGEAMAYYERASQANSEHSDAVEELGKWLEETGFEPPEPTQASATVEASTSEIESVAPVMEPSDVSVVEEPEESAGKITNEQTNESIQTESPVLTQEPTAADTETASQSDAVSTAKDYLDFMAFSRQGLIEQLEYEGFTTEDATYGVDNSGADWMEQAVLTAQDYLDFSSFSRQELIDQLEYEGFTHEQAVHGVDAAGL